MIDLGSGSASDSAVQSPSGIVLRFLLKSYEDDVIGRLLDECLCLYLDEYDRSE